MFYIFFMFMQFFMVHDVCVWTWIYALTLCEFILNHKKDDQLFCATTYFILFMH
jgi:hypothetical protein